MHRFRDLKIWQRSRTLVKSVYDYTSAFPNNETFVLSKELRRTVISIPSNIAEGCGRNSNKELNRFLDYSLGSSYELETQLELAFDLGFLNEKSRNELISEIQEIIKMIYIFKQTLSS